MRRIGASGSAADGSGLRTIPFAINEAPSEGSSEGSGVRRGAMIVCRFQGFVKQNLVVDGKIKGIPLPIDLPT